MKAKPDSIIINVRDAGGTYVARAKGLNITASCTMGEKFAAQACAEKVYARGGYELKEVTRFSYLASAKVTRDTSAITAFRLKVTLAGNTVELNYGGTRQLLIKLDEFGDDCGDGCRQMRDDIRFALSTVERGVDKETLDQLANETSITETITVTAEVNANA